MYAIQLIDSEIAVILPTTLCLKKWREFTPFSLSSNIIHIVNAQNCFLEKKQKYIRNLQHKVTLLKFCCRELLNFVVLLIPLQWTSWRFLHQWHARDGSADSSMINQENFWLAMTLFLLFNILLSAKEQFYYERKSF